MRKLIVGFLVVALVVSSLIVLTPQDTNARITWQIYFVVDVGCASGWGVGVSVFDNGEFMGSSYGCYSPA